MQEKGRERERVCIYIERSDYGREGERVRDIVREKEREGER